MPVVVPPPADYAALGAARQAAWALGTQEGSFSAQEPPHWESAVLSGSQVTDPGDDLAAGGAVRQQYAAVRDQTHPGALPMS